jgi:hypothetical protein
LKRLWEYLAQYCYLPRLFDREVLLQAVRDGVGRLDAPFAYATGINEHGRHTGLVFRSLGSIYFDENSLLVHPDHIAEMPEALQPDGRRPDGTPPVGTPPPGATPGATTPASPAQNQLTRYYGRVRIDAQRVNKDMGVIVEEVIERLTSQLGCEVEITLEVQAKKADGFDESAVRTIGENSRTLKFEDYGFEEG